MSCSGCNKVARLPIVLDCNCTYCFLCLKDTIQSGGGGKCNVCQTDITLDIDNVSEDFRDTLENLVNTPVWLYCSNSMDGWWMYDIDISKSIENCYTSNLPTCSFTVGAQTYRVMYSTMLQTLVSIGNQSPKQRQIKRVVFTSNMIDQLNIKGISGIFFKTIEDQIGKFV